MGRPAHRTANPTIPGFPEARVAVRLQGMLHEISTRAARSRASAARPRRPTIRLGATARRCLLTMHIVAGVGLLGTVAAVLAVNIRAATTTDAALSAAAYDLLPMFTVLFGIPLSFISLVSGTVLGLGSKWGVVRHGWVAAKLALQVSVILVGALVLGPGTDAMREGTGDAGARLIAGSAYDVAALLLATGLSVFKPRRRTRRPAPSPTPGPAWAADPAWRWRSRAPGAAATAGRPPARAPRGRPSPRRRAPPARPAATAWVSTRS